MTENPFEALGDFPAAFGSSLSVGLAGFAAGSALISILGGSGGGGGGIDIPPLGAGGGSDTCATYSESECSNNC